MTRMRLVSRSDGRSDIYRRIRIESTFGKLTVLVTDGHLPYPYGRETTGYEVANLTDTLAKAKAAGVEILVSPYTADHGMQPSFNFLAVILPRSTRPQVNRVRLVERVCLMMRIVLILAAALLIGVPSTNAQVVGTAPSVIHDRSYKLLREDEDWSFLRDRSLREDFWDPIKYIPLRRNSPDWYLTFSGEAREVWEQTGNNNWGQQPLLE